MLLERIADPRKPEGGGLLLLEHDDDRDVTPWPALVEEARRVAGGLHGLGAGPGAPVAILGRTSREAIVAALACAHAGAPMMVLAQPVPGADAEAFAGRTRALLERLGVRLLLHDRAYEGVAGERPAHPLDALPRSAATTHAAAPEDSVLYQLTSGTTAGPRAVDVTYGALEGYMSAHLSAAGIEGVPHTLVSWLPLQFDMGLVASLLVCAAIGATLVQVPVERYARAPQRWLGWAAGHRATMICAPNFAYALAARTVDANLDLSALRMAFNGGDVIVPESVEAFLAATRLDAGTMLPAYGLAEAVSGVTLTPPGRGPRFDTVDRRALEHDARAVPAAGGRRLTGCGPAYPGVEVRVVDPVTRAPLGPRAVGEVEIGGASVTRGYVNDPVATEASFVGGRLRTGDLGYLLPDGELVLCGRRKDVIILAGRKLAPDEVELAVTGVPGVRAGCVVAFGVRGGVREELVVVAEVKAAGLRDAIAAAVRREVGVAPLDVACVPPGTVPKSGSGKLQRSLCRARWERGEYADGA